jgi:hypothetical protein
MSTEWSGYIQPPVRPVKTLRPPRSRDRKQPGSSNPPTQENQHGSILRAGLTSLVQAFTYPSRGSDFLSQKIAGCALERHAGSPGFC